MGLLINDDSPAELGVLSVKRHDSHNSTTSCNILRILSSYYFKSTDMKTRTFLSCMLLLAVLTSVLLAFTVHSKQAYPQVQTQAENTCDDDTLLTPADGGLIWESVSWHLLSAVQ
jgi:hypothetical protein